ncbi:MAG: LruC domain-containing protein, partial [Gammaproteobacteria bacterium]|nr:LruC domain-containing protein [Gammaproteobacteria bacterium]
ADNRVVQLNLSGDLKAMGASFHNGFAIQLPGVTGAEINQARTRFEINGQVAAVDLLEENTEYAVLKISNDLWKHVKPDTGCWFYRTQTGCNSSSTFTFSIRLPFVDGIPFQSFPAAPYNPFIFATPDTQHGTAFSEHPGRGLEIHLKNKAPTSLANADYFGLMDDASESSNSSYYQTENGLPWAVAISVAGTENWLHPREWVD